MTDIELDKKICRIVGWSYSGGWAFEKTGDQLNVTHRLMKLKELIAELGNKDEQKNSSN